MVYCVRGCSHTMSAKNRGVQTPPNPLVIKIWTWSTLSTFLLFLFFYFSTVIIHHPSSIINHPSTIIHHPSSIIHHPSLFIHHQSLLDCPPLEIGWISQISLISNLDTPTTTSRGFFWPGLIQRPPFRDGLIKYTFQEESVNLEIIQACILGYV